RPATKRRFPPANRSVRPRSGAALPPARRPPPPPPGRSLGKPSPSFVPVHPVPRRFHATSGLLPRSNKDMRRPAPRSASSQRAERRQLVRDSPQFEHRLGKGAPAGQSAGV